MGLISERLSEWSSRRLGYWRDLRSRREVAKSRTSLFSEEALRRLEQLQREWAEKYKEAARLAPERKASFRTSSGIEVKPLYTPLDVSWLDYESDLGFPGEYPFTRGVYTTMYRSKVWTMRQFAGFGTPEDTNRRFKFLLEHGETGLSLAFDMPTLYGYDPDNPVKLRTCSHLRWREWGSPG
jgi:methylmalonyl-CoA mutase N-terminal domain/subunit